MNNNGPSIEPCGTPHEQEAIDDDNFQFSNFDYLISVREVGLEPFKC